MVFTRIDIFIRRPSGARRVRVVALRRYSKFPIPDSLDSLDSLDSRFTGSLDSWIIRPFVEAKESYRQGRSVPKFHFKLIMLTYLLTLPHMGLL